jgi:uroporphyrinogen-III synthase
MSTDEVNCSSNEANQVGAKDVSIILCRSEASDDDYVETLKTFGFIYVTQVSLLEFKYLNEEQLIDHLSDEHFNGLVLLSPRCVTAVQNALEKSPENVRERWTKQVVFSIGDKTSAHCRQKLCMTPVMSAATTSNELAEFITDYFNKDTLAPCLLIPCSSISKQDLPECLSKHGIEYKQIFVYETVASPASLERLEEYILQSTTSTVIIIFFSPSNVDAVIPIFRKNYEKRLLFSAIGKTTAAFMAEKGIPVFFTSSRPDPSSLAASLIESIFIPTE